MHYYKKNIGDYYKKAGKLSMLQHGAYTLLLDACYDRERFPTLNEAIDWAWAITEDEIDAVKFVLNKFFYLDDDVFFQKRIKEDLGSYHDNCETNKRIALEREAKRREALEKDEERARSVHEACTNDKRIVNEAPPNHKPLTTNQELLTKNKDKDKRHVDKIDKYEKDVDEIFKFWCEIMKKSKAKLSPERKKKIVSRLKDGFKVEEIKTAIVNCSNTAHNQGRNPQQSKYDDIEIICRTIANLERFRDNPGNMNSPLSNLSKTSQENYHKIKDWKPPA